MTGAACKGYRNKRAPEFRFRCSLLLAKNDPAKLGHFCRAESAPFDALRGVMSYLGAEIPVGDFMSCVNAVAREGLIADRRLSCGCGLQGILRILCRELRSRVRDPGGTACVPYVSAPQINLHICPRPLSLKRFKKSKPGACRFLYFWREKVSTIRRNFRTTLERPTVRSPCRRNCSFATGSSLKMTRQSWAIFGAPEALHLMRSAA